MVPTAEASQRSDTILVGVDGSDTSVRALDWAIMLAQRTGQSLTAVCSYALPSFTAAALDGGYAALDDSAIAAGAQQVADDARARAAAAGVEAQARVSAGDAAGALIAASAKAALAVVGTRGGSGFTERLLGTVSSALPAHATCPVVVVPRTYGGEGPLKPPRRIVVGTDGSELAFTATTAAMRQAQLWDAEVVIIAGVPIASGSGLLAWLPASVDRTEVMSSMWDKMERFVARAKNEVPGVEPRLEVMDGTGAELLVAASRDADLLVVGSRGRGGFAGLLLGSTSQALLHHAACPVMVVNKKTTTTRA